MALGKSSKKTQKTISEAPLKSKATGAKPTTTRAAQATQETPVKAAATSTTTKARKKSPEVIDTEARVPESVAVHSESEPLLAMAASAGAAEQPVSVVHSTSPSNGHSNGSHHGNGSHSMNAGHKHASREEIAHLAYLYWVERGYTHGSADEDWKRAEAELAKHS